MKQLFSLSMLFLLASVIGCAPGARFDRAVYRPVSGPDGLESASFTSDITATGLAGQQIIYRVRLLDGRFHPIRSWNDRFRDRDGNVAAATALMVFDSPWRFDNITLSIPAAELEVRDVEGPVTAEFSLLGVDGKVYAVRGVPTGLVAPPANPPRTAAARTAQQAPEAPASTGGELSEHAESPEPPDLFSMMYDAIQRTPTEPSEPSADTESAGSSTEPTGGEAEAANPPPSSEMPQFDAEPAAPEAPPSNDGDTGATDGEYVDYVVKPGDTLTGIARRLYGDTGRWIDIFQLNRDQLDSPDLIREGMHLRIPRE